MYETALTWAYCKCWTQSYVVQFLLATSAFPLQYNCCIFYINTTFIRFSTICVSSVFASEMGPVSSLTRAIWGSLIPKINTRNTPRASSASINRVWFPFIQTSKGGIQIRLIQTHKHLPLNHITCCIHTLAHKHSKSGISSLSLFIRKEQRCSGFSNFSSPITRDENKINIIHTHSAAYLDIPTLRKPQWPCSLLMLKKRFPQVGFRYVDSDGAIRHLKISQQTI